MCTFDLYFTNRDLEASCLPCLSIFFSSHAFGMLYGVYVLCSGSEKSKLRRLFMWSLHLLCKNQKHAYYSIVSPVLAV